MAASDTSQVSSLPLPPTQYINFYTDENCKRNRAPRPPQPPQDSYSMFGNQYHTDDMIIRPLESQGLKRLYHQNYDHKRELKKLNVSLLVNFLDLLDILIRSPESQKREEKLMDIDLLFIHMHHLINEFRPHQARETLRVTLELQKRQRLEITERFNKQLEKVMEMLNCALSKLTETTEVDIKTVVPMEVLDTLLGKQPEAETGDPCSSQDRLMCSIIDKM